MVLLKIVIVCIAATTLNCITAAQDASQDPPVHCHALNPDNYTCAHCIQLDPRCAWCSATKWDRVRCDTLDRLAELGCTQIEYPEHEFQMIVDNDLSNTGVDPESAVQIKPQEISIKLRPKQEYTFPVTFRQAVDYPVDLYYLMDLSRSMKDDKTKLSILGDLIAARMRSITKNFRLGFGSFVDKKVMPFVDARPEKADTPCTGCVPPYGFQNHMSLSDQTDQFSREVNATPVSGNLDAPEGGFDAIMQTLACPEAIGWRNKSRKMIVFSTDAGFHYAGDARLGGIVVPNDGNCHLDERGLYQMSTEQDYPSVAQLHEKIRDMKANLIFAVTESQVKLYEHLKAALPEVSTAVGKLAEDSSNIVELIEGEYHKISEKIVMVDSSNYPVKVAYKTRCKGAVWNDTNVCEGIRVNDEVTYNVTISVEECTDQRHFEFDIGPSGLTDMVHVNLDVICGCECEKSRHVKDPACNNKGDLVCGVCDCFGTYRGRKCECDAPGMSTAELDNQCRKGNNTQSPLCEGRGTCECGKCICKTRDEKDQLISGIFCQCDNFNCPRHNRKICNHQGACICQACACKPGWTGRACECATSEETCKSSNGKICNDRGTCICGVCRCSGEEGDNRYSGPTCEVCPTCPDQCQQLKPCVQCKVWKSGSKHKDETCDECTTEPVVVNKLPDKNSTTDHCQAVDRSDGCTFYWAFNSTEAYGVENSTVWALDKKKCPPPVPVLAIVLGVIAGIVVIGLLLLFLWKILTIIHDRREYAKFEEESKRAKWDTGENPIFNPATTTFKNPAYGGKQM